MSADHSTVDGSHASTSELPDTAKAEPLASGIAVTGPMSASDIVDSLPDDAVSGTLLWTLKMTVAGKNLENLPGQKCRPQAPS